MSEVLSMAVSAKHVVFLCLAAGGLALCLAGRVSRAARLTALAAAFVLLGGILGLLIPDLGQPLGMHPSPMCSLNKLLAFAWLKGRFALGLAVSLGVMILLSVLFRKSFCGWACPLGAFQELLHSVPGPAKLHNLPFPVSNWVRAGLMAAFVLGLLGFGVITYDSFNGFEALHWGWEPGATVTLGLILLASLFYFRPYCYLVCPIGLVTWALEPLSLIGVQKDGKACDGCLACVSKAACPSLEGIVKGEARWTPDCSSCGRCLESCPKGALKVGLRSFRGWV
ncbi:MAG: 4Fe-4S binding protein [Elusimicrobia bacterium]|nr:4Fe-4S binding protein [Elusimicrobiota bacterium]